MGDGVAFFIFAGALVIVKDLAQIDGGHNAVPFGIHVEAVDLIYIKNGNVEGILKGAVATERLQNALADGIALVFQRAVNAAVLSVEGDAAKMTQEPVHRADDLAGGEACLDQLGGEGVINEVFFLVGGNALDVAFAPGAGIDGVHKDPPFQVVRSTRLLPIKAFNSRFSLWMGRPTTLK